MIRHGLLAGALAILFAAFALLAPVTAHAGEAVSQGGDSQLVVRHESGGQGISGSKVNIYRVATIEDDGSIKPVGAFASYDVLWDISSSGSKQALANTLEGYVERDDIPPTHTAVTNSQGAAVFPADGKRLQDGWYLVVIKLNVVGGSVFESSALLLSISEDSDAIEATVKVSLLSVSGSKTIDVSKVWKGTDPNRPTSVQAQLLRDGSVYKTVTLNKSNGWHVAFEGLSNAHKWSVVEKDVPEGYKVSVVKDGGFVTLVNTYAPDEEDDEPLPETGIEDDKPQKPGKPSTPGGEKLPQTGGMWWPVPVLLIAGLAFFAVGLFRRSLR